MRQSRWRAGLAAAYALGALVAAGFALSDSTPMVCFLGGVCAVWASFSALRQGVLALAAGTWSGSSSREGGVLTNPFGLCLRWRADAEGVALDVGPGPFHSLRLAFAGIACLGLLGLASAGEQLRAAAGGADPDLDGLTLIALLAAPALVLGSLGVVGFSVRRAFRLEVQGPLLLERANLLGAPRARGLPRETELLLRQKRSRYDLLLRSPAGEEHPLASGPGRPPPALEEASEALQRAMAALAQRGSARGTQRGSGSSTGGGSLAR